ncbi:hypothetical protein QWZ14_01580 [Paeniroseomonas aquatica]|uniref:Uncharacterized protein n=1 Tax=Paeniroseomonas aquatica TaxID=373043 RepID=A0ABT8A0R0_9PROT|nr:hypothetical protein [Paeniroseomonas aquatica]MDN3563068.1 hypothetical protein [Paeniroseomonas aquatica]
MSDKHAVKGVSTVTRQPSCGDGMASIDRQMLVAGLRQHRIKLLKWEFQPPEHTLDGDLPDRGGADPAARSSG